jgi:hypothetical protein
LITSERKVLLATDGEFVKEADIRNPDGSRFKIKLRGERVIVRLLDRGCKNAPGNRFCVIPPGKTPVPTAEPTLFLLSPPFQAGKTSVSVQVQVTWSLTLLISVRLRSIIGDIIEEYGEKRKRMGASRAVVWLLIQSVCSVRPVFWQMLRYDLNAGISAWKLWRS